MKEQEMMKHKLSCNAGEAVYGSPMVMASGLRGLAAAERNHQPYTSKPERKGE